MPLVKLTDNAWVNPLHVTCIEQRNHGTAEKPRPMTLVWVKKDAGYGTGSITLEGHVAKEVATRLNKCEGGKP